MRCAASGEWSCRTPAMPGFPGRWDCRSWRSWSSTSAACPTSLHPSASPAGGCVPGVAGTRAGRRSAGSRVGSGRPRRPSTRRRQRHPPRSITTIADQCRVIRHGWCPGMQHDVNTNARHIPIQPLHPDGHGMADASSTGPAFPWCCSIGIWFPTRIEASTTWSSSTTGGPDTPSRLT